MQEFSPMEYRIETASAQAALSAASTPGETKQHAAYIGLDVHKETIAIAVAEPGREEPLYRGEIARGHRRRQRR